MFTPIAVALAAAFWLAYLVALAVEKHLFDHALRLWNSLSRPKKCVASVLFVCVVAYAGTKPLSGGGDDGGDDPTGTNVVEIVEGDATNLVENIGGEASTNLVENGEAQSGEGEDGDAQSGESLPPPLLMMVRPLASGSAMPPPTPPCPLSLDAVGRGEPLDFSAPEGAVVATNWLKHGVTTGRVCVSTSDWDFPFGTNILRKFAAFADGRLEPWPGGGGITLAPLVAPLGIVPEANWTLLAPTNRPSLFWWTMRDNALVCTWQNVLLGREIDCPVSFQAELRATGGVTYRYDLGRLASDDLLTNAVVFATDNSEPLCLCVEKSLTSIAFRSTEEVACDECAASLATAMGDSDPFACPPNSTNTVLEHAYYSGTTNGTIHLPESSPVLAVLRVTVGGTGSGELLVGGRAVPLRAPASSLVPHPSSLLLSVPRGETLPVYLRGDSTLSLSLDSDDFAFGVLPDLSGRHCRGWINFPYTEASHPCIHSFMAHETDVTLPVGEGADDLTCTWNETDDVEVWNRPPRSARITGHFDPRDERPVTYTLSHPRYLFGQTEYEQNARYCPKPSDDDPTDYLGVGIPFPDECWCCHWQTCDTNCACGCSHCGDWTVSPTNDYDFARTNYPHMGGVLKIRTPREHSASVALSVPTGMRRCCPCPEHWTNGVSCVYTRRVSVMGPSGSEFRSSGEPVTVRIAATEPSYEPGDGRALFATNGVPMTPHNYTCLGVEISGAYGVDLAALNAKSESFGYPFTVSTNLDSDTQLILDTKVLLPGGRVTLSVEDATAPIEVWAIDANSWTWRKLADANGLSFDMSMAEWRRLAGYEKSPDAPRVGICLLSPTAGQTTLVLRYWNVVGGEFVEDEARQRVTAVNPPLLADVSHDGKIGDADAALQTAGLPFRFWINEDRIKGDYAGTVSDDSYNAANLKVDGKYDLVNFFPLVADVARFKAEWGDSATFILRSRSRYLHCCVLEDVEPDCVHSIQTGMVHAVGGMPFESASLDFLSYQGTNLTSYVSSDKPRVVLAFEASDWIYPSVSPELVVKLGGREVFSYCIPLEIDLVDHMYRYVNLRPAASNPQFVPVAPNIPQNLPDEETDGKHYVFVHGYNVNASQSREWARAVFKRLWWTGSRSKFTAVDWYGDYSQLSPSVPVLGGNSPNYYRNVLNAFNSASALKSACDMLSGQKYLMAHSLGNMLVSSAIADHSLTNYVKYFMMNAAVPLEAYDDSAYAQNMVDSAWMSVPQFRASRWSNWFDEPDFRARLSWRGRFGYLPRVENCYSQTEDVLENPSANGMGNAWGAQELLKGCSIWHGINLAGSGVMIEGGWGINSAFVSNARAYVPLVGFNPGYFEKYSREENINCPLFTEFADARMQTTNGLIIVDNQLRARMLGDAIPAESFAAGSNPLDGVINYNYQDHVNHGWYDDKNEWRHSDIKNAALWYVYDFFVHLQEEQ